MEMIQVLGRRESKYRFDFEQVFRQVTDKAIVFVKFSSHSFKKTD